MKDVIPLGRRGGLKEKPTETNKRKPDELEDPEEMNASKVRVTGPQRVTRLVRTPSPSPPPFSPIPLPPSPNPRTSPPPERYPPSTDRKVRNDSHKKRMPTTTHEIAETPPKTQREIPQPAEIKIRTQIPREEMEFEERPLLTIVEGGTI